MKKTLLFTGALLAFIFTSLTAPAGGRREATETAAGNGGNTGGGKLSVFVSILPQRYFVERIGGKETAAEVLVKPGQSPHSYEPTPSQVTALGNADIVFTIGVDFEASFVPEIRSALPDLTIVETNSGISYREMEGHGADHDHENEAREDGEHEGDDPHIWLSLGNGKIIAANIKDALTEAAPEYTEAFEKNYKELIRDIDNLDKELKRLLAPLKGETFLVFHPAFGYFADDYGLEQEAVETGGSEPTPKQLEAIIAEAKEENVRVIFVQPQFAKKSAETIAAAINGAVIPIDPLAPDWLENMEKIAEAVKEGLGG